MTIARRKQLCLDVTPYYHCITRCVRRSYLCGRDKLTGKNFNHRRDWIEKRIFLLADAFCIDIVGYSIMSNHYHLVLKVNQPLTDSLTDDEVIERWRKLYKGPEVIKRYLEGTHLTDDDQKLLQNTVTQWRDNLSNISRFMGNLNEFIARAANKEDDCKGSFWESRFKLQAILDLSALLRTLCYVDLNPIRAKQAKTPESSQYTSVKYRLEHDDKRLMPFAKSHEKILGKESLSTTVLPISFKEYLELLDWTGRELKLENRGAISAASPPIMARLGYTSEQWMKMQTPRSSWTQKAVGQLESIKRYCTAIRQRWIWQETY